jgi:hypothetical protein
MTGTEAVAPSSGAARDGEREETVDEPRQRRTLPRSWAAIRATRSGFSRIVAQRAGDQADRRQGVPQVVRDARGERVEIVVRALDAGDVLGELPAVAREHAERRPPDDREARHEPDAEERFDRANAREPRVGGGEERALASWLRLATCRGDPGAAPRAASPGAAGSSGRGRARRRAPRPSRRRGGRGIPRRAAGSASTRAAPRREEPLDRAESRVEPADEPSTSLSSAPGRRSRSSAFARRWVRSRPISPTRKVERSAVRPRKSTSRRARWTSSTETVLVPTPRTTVATRAQPRTGPGAHLARAACPIRSFQTCPRLRVN